MNNLNDDLINNNNGDNGDIIKQKNIEPISSESSPSIPPPSTLHLTSKSINDVRSADNNNNNNDSNTNQSSITITPTTATVTSETIYEFGSHFENPSHVISEKVQNLASQIYNELQKILTRYNDDEESVNGLMPLIVNILESLDLALIENQQLQVDLELCKDDNEQLVQAFEKEKQHKKKIEQRLFEYEFHTEEEKQHYQQHIDSLANIVKMLELKAKNSSDHSSRLEEKENEMKKEYSKLHERYNELRRSHFDLMERVKIILGTTDNDNPLQQQSGISYMIKDAGSSYTNLVNSFQRNLQKFSSSSTVNNQEFDNNNYDLTTKSDDNTYDQMSQYVQNSRNLNSNSNQNQSTTNNQWIETEMSYDDTTTIIEDVDELQKDYQNNSATSGGNNSNNGKPKEYQSLSDNFFGMEKEIENLITENNELMATKNALNIVKDDLIAKVDELQSDLAMCNNEIQQREAVQERLKARIAQLEEELKKNKEELDDTKHKLASLKEDEEEGIPMAQRKRFTRVEMSRVLMERNTYKEKYFELQEALKWAELSRATRNENDSKRSNFWKFFSNLFNPSPTTGTIQSSNVPGAIPTATPAIRYSANPASSSAINNQLSAIPALDAMRRRARLQQQQQQQNGDLELIMDSDLTSERTRAMKNLKTHVNRAGNGDRIQAYGWSITGASSNGSTSSDGTIKTNKALSLYSNTSVPVPIYCRPLGGDDIGMKIWCATAVDLSGGEAGFPDSSNASNGDLSNANLSQQQNDALTDLEQEIDEVIREQQIPNDQQYSTFVWICSVSHSKSKVTIVNIRSNPGEVLDSFFIKTHLLCICSVPGAKNNDFIGDHDVHIDEQTTPEIYQSFRREKPLNDISTSITFSSPVPSVHSDISNNYDNNSVATEESSAAKQQAPDDSTINKAEEAASVNSLPLTNEPITEAKNVTLEKLNEYVAYTQPPSPTIGDNSMITSDDAVNEGQQSSSQSSSAVAAETNTIRSSTSSTGLPIQPMSTRLPTMWLGGQNGVLYVHSSIAQWSHCIAIVHLSDSILHIVHYRGRVFVALANGQCCIFYRCEQTGEWNFNQYYTLDIGIYSNMMSSTNNDSSNEKPVQQTALYSIRCLEIVKDVIWLSYRNLIFIANTLTFKVLNSFIAHPRKETYVRHLAAIGDGVWCSFRLDSTLRLYSSYKPYQHIQTIDIEPYVTKMIMSKSFNFVRITALKANNNRLWIGTSNGVVLCLPLQKKYNHSDNNNSNNNNGNDQLNDQNLIHKKLQTTEATGLLTLQSYIPLCDIQTIQLSFHGHKDNVKFFVCTNNLILSGGEGYIDFRINNLLNNTTGINELSATATASATTVANQLSKGDRSHLILWEITQ